MRSPEGKTSDSVEAADGLGHVLPVPAFVKDASVLDCLTQLERAMGSGVFRVVDHWDADLCAVGIASPGDAKRLVYVSTWQKEAGRYYYECEIPRLPTSEDEPNYAVVEKADDVDFDTLLAAVRRHFTR
jgi:hypothetical protein